MSVSLNLSGMADVFDAAHRYGKPMPPRLYRLMSACLRELSKQAADLETRAEASVPVEGAPAPNVVDLGPILSSTPGITMGQLLGPFGRAAEVIPLPVVRVERREPEDET